MFNKDCEKIAKEELAEMSKSQLELVGRDNGIELDKRKTKKALVDELYEATVMSEALNDLMKANILRKSGKHLHIHLYRLTRYCQRFTQKLLTEKDSM